MRGKSIRLSPPRRLVCDMLKAAASVPTVPVQRRLQLAQVVAARQAQPVRLSWTAIFIKAYAKVAAAMPELRRAYVKLPWPHLYEYPRSVAILAVERDYVGEKAVFFGRIKDPAQLPLTELSRMIRAFQETPVEMNKHFRRALWFGRLPGPLRRLLCWLGMNIGRQRANYFGTFYVSVYSSLGAECLHPLSPATTTLNYGIIAPDGGVDARIIYDHRVLDGSTVARALQRLESELTGEILAELRATAVPSRRAA